MLFRSGGCCHSHAEYVAAGSLAAEAGGAEDAIAAAGLVAVVALVVVRLALALAPVAGLQVY